MTTFQDVLAQTKSEIREVGVEDVQARFKSDSVVVVDVRQRDEIAEGTLEGALAIPRGLLEVELPKAVDDKDQEVILFCAGGTRSALAAKSAQELGYTNVSSMAGGFGRWKQAGAPFHMPSMPIPAQEPEGDAQGPAVETISAQTLQERLGGDAAPVVIDVREDDETALGYIPGAVLEPRGRFEMRVEGHARDKSQPLVLVSSRGARAAWVVSALQALGYAQPLVLEGGFEAWKTQGFEVEVPRRLSTEDRLRYSRHLLIPEVGEEGQLKLKESKVLLMGAGGLGSPAAYYLAAAGIGTLGIIDSDVVDRSNLQRQILHTDARVGVPKVESARETLLALNPTLTINT
ncbi:MAG: ThiF family adenylyltransferase, partial [Myxococcota bacterium]